MKKFTRFFLCLIFLTNPLLDLDAQNSTKASKSFEKANAAFEKADFPAAWKLFTKALETENKEPVPDPDFISVCHEFIAYSAYYSSNYIEVLFHLEEALTRYREIEYFDGIKRIFLFSGEFYDYLKKYDIELEVPEWEKYEIKEFHFTISKIEKMSEYEAVVTIDGGAYEGIYENAKGEVVSAYNQKNEERPGGLVLGTAEVKEVNIHSARVQIKLNDPLDFEMELFNGDMINIPVKIKETEYHSIFFNLAALNIRFLTQNSEVLYHNRQIMHYDSKRLESDIIQIMIQDIRETGAYFKESADDYPQFMDTIEEGRYKGMNMLDAMINTKASDVLSFLYFVDHFPGKYMGHTWKINETYATWLINYTPISFREMNDSLMAAKNREDFERIFYKYQNDFYDGDFFDYWEVEAQKLAQKNNYEQAFAICDLLKNIVDITLDSNFKADYLFSLGYVYHHADQNYKAIQYYGEAKELYQKSNNILMESYCVTNTALVFNGMGRYLDAYENYLLSAELKMETLKTDSSSDVLISLGNSLLGVGTSLYNLGNYTEAENYYKQAESCYMRSNSIEGLEQLADVYYWMGKTCEKTKGESEAELYYKKRLQTGKDLGNSLIMAAAYDNLAYNEKDQRKANAMYWKAFRLKYNAGDLSDAGFSMSNIAQTYWMIGEFDSAIYAHHQAITLREKAANYKGQAYSWEKLGELYTQSGDPKKAMEAFLKARELYVSIGDSHSLAEVFVSIGDNYSEVKENSAALNYYFQAVDIFKSLSSQSSLSDVHESIGGLYYDDKKYLQAEKHYKISLQIRKELGEQANLIYNYINLGLIETYHYYDLGTAETYYDSALIIARDMGNDYYIAYCNKNIAYIYNSKGQYESALELLNKALDVYIKLGNKEKEAETVLEIGSYFLYKGDFIKANHHFRKSLSISEESKNNKGIASAYTIMGSMERMRGDFRKAMMFQYKSYLLSEEADNPWGMATAHIGLGNIYNSIANSDSAIFHYLKADSIYRIEASEYSRATPLNNIGDIYSGQADYEKALCYFNEALEILKKSNIDLDFHALILNNIAESYLKLGDYQKSRDYFNQSIDLIQKTSNNRRLASTLILLAELDILEKQSEEAKKNLERAYSLYVEKTEEKPFIIEFYHQLATVDYTMQNYDLAKKHFYTSINASKTAGLKKELWETLYLLSKVYNDIGQKDSSIILLKESVGVIEFLKNNISGGEQAQEVFNNDKTVQEIYTEIVKLLLEAGEVEEAMVFLEKANSDNLNTKFQGMQMGFVDEDKNKIIEKEKELKDKLTIVESELSKEKSKPDIQQNPELIQKLEQIRTVTQNEYVSYVNDIVEKEPSLSRYFAKSEDPTMFRTHRKRIPSDMAVLMYLIGDSSLYIFVGTKDSSFAKEVAIPRKTLERMIFDFYNKLKMPDFEEGRIDTVRGNKLLVDPKNMNKQDFYTLSSDLYHILIDPVFQEIKSKSKLAIIPNGAIYYIPFQALLNKNEDKNRYLGLDFAVFYSNKISYITAFYYDDETELSLLAIGNSDSSLHYAEIEVKNLESIYDNVEILLRDQATKKCIFEKSGDYSIIHFATHGILDYNDYENSYLVLASDMQNGDDGHLKISEIYRINNIDNCNMVTLSACETALSLEMLEGWPITTASAFLNIGVPSVIASLWKIDDKATSILMEKFYANLKSMNKVDAIRNAQLYLASDPRYSHPYYWAPFLLVGSWK